MKNSIHTLEKLDRVFNPRSVAVVSDKQALDYMWLKSLTSQINGESYPELPQLRARGKDTEQAGRLLQTETGAIPELAKEWYNIEGSLLAIAKFKMKTANCKSQKGEQKWSKFDSTG